MFTPQVTGFDFAVNMLLDMSCEIDLWMCNF